MPMIFSNPFFLKNLHQGIKRVTGRPLPLQIAKQQKKKQ
jgi:hypothetical protein